MNNLEKKLDIAFQKLAEGKHCHFCNKPASEIHHLKAREDKVYRWDKRNALPVCTECHILGVHGGRLKAPIVEFERIGLKDYLLREGLIFREFLELKMKDFATDISVSRKKPARDKLSRSQKRTSSKTDEVKKANEYRRKKWKEDYRKMKEWKKSVGR